jgi:5-methylcytosine-specific restriction protein A
MAKEFARKFYNSKIWKQTRESYISKVHGLCERCQRDGKITPGYILHHKIELTRDNINDVMVTLNQDNLEYVCLVCHNKEHFGINGVTAEGLMFDEDGNLVVDECMPL